MATSMELGFEPALLSRIVEKKGTLFLRSDHMKYNKSTLNSDWHAQREAEPKDYDINAPDDGKRNLLKATYKRIGTEDKFESSTTATEALSEGQRLRPQYEERQSHKQLINTDNFTKFTTVPRTVDGPERGYGSVLPRHKPDYDIRHLETTQKVDYQYPYDWSPVEQDTIVEDENRHHRKLSEFTAHQKRAGINIWQDC